MSEKEKELEPGKNHDQCDPKISYGIYCKLTGKKFTDVTFPINSGSCRCASSDVCEMRGLL